ncbi:hypothetical protein [Puniceicoccus vermicola]|uniref:Uncharacterized protein n=1 Tax=Puniceicoccus vermicola TaxID=388746 RepID=A0A7X1E542_9BACT|nr:hypothetical protein [Puniceicoccus vermicola]MBC2602734.1 hypothetical protein [Puniceicoccus vermicola]
MKKDLSLRQTAKIVSQPGGVRGVGMLIEYPAPGPQTMEVRWSTSKPRNETYPPITLVRVFSPSGDLVAFHEFPGDESGIFEADLPIPEGSGGIWRISFSGGRSGDLVEICAPKSDTWGVRGEMGLGVTPEMPRPGYVWVPPSAEGFLVALESGSPRGFRILTEAGEILTEGIREDSPRGIGRVEVDSPELDSVVQVVVPEQFAGGLFFEGVPGLICPTPEAAERLKGGLVESHGIWVGGPLQARARDWMVRQSGEIGNPNLDFSEIDPEALEEPRWDALAYGKYGPINNLGGILEAQNRNLDPSSPWYGISAPDGYLEGEPTWQNFRYTKRLAWMDASAIASAVAFDSEGNPAYGNEELIRRATLFAFFHIASMQGDDLLRDNDLYETTHPIVLTFFIYPGALSQAYWELEPWLSPEVRSIWKQGMMAVGDKSADFTGYMSNQWAHMMRGHLEVFLATGEERFLDYFERMMTAYLEGAHGVNSNFGQHPAGYFLENGGPDGNYDRLNTYCLVSSYWEYQELPEADPEIVDMMREGIEKNLEFRKFFWLPQPSGRLHSPTSMNCRTQGPFAGNGYPGDMMSRSEFPLGAARFDLVKGSEDDEPGEAWTFSYLAKSDGQAVNVIKEGIRRGIHAEAPGKSARGLWLPYLAQAFSLPEKVGAASLPFEENDRVWDLPGLFAWNLNRIYGVVFYEVPGSTRDLGLLAGGGPTVLWSPEVGTFLASMQPSSPVANRAVKNAKDFTFSCVYRETATGSLAYNAQEPVGRAETSGENLTEFVSRLGEDTDLRWNYQEEPDGLRLGVSLETKGSSDDNRLNLPILVSEEARVRISEDRSSLSFHRGSGRVRISWNSDQSGILETSALKEIRRLVIPFPRDGEPLTLQFAVEDEWGDEPQSEAAP